MCLLVFVGSSAFIGVCNMTRCLLGGIFWRISLIIVSRVPASDICLGFIG